MPPAVMVYRYFTLTVSICSTLIPLDLRCFTKSGESLSVIVLPTPTINRSGWGAKRGQATLGLSIHHGDGIKRVLVGGRMSKPCL